MKAAIFFCSCLVFGAMSCERSEPDKKPTPAAEPAAKPVRVSVGAPMARQASSNKTPSNDGNAFRGKVETKSESGAAEQGEITIDFNGDEIGGSLTIAGNAFELAGEKQENNLRLWAVSQPGDPAKVRRGYLIGKSKGDSFEGALTISGHAGVPVISGSWSAGK